MINIKVDFEFKNKGTNVFGVMLVPFDGKSFYRPHSILITGGIIDFSHRANSGVKAASKREYKEWIISKYCVESNAEARIERPFYYNGGKTSGLVTFMSKIQGANANRENLLFFRNKGYEHYKIAKLLQNLEKYKSNICKTWEIVEINEIKSDVKEALQIISNKYYENIESATIDIKESE